MSPVSSSIDHYDRLFFYIEAVEHGSPADFFFLWQKFETEEDKKERNAIRLSLCYAQDPWIIDWYVCFLYFSLVVEATPQ